MRPCLSRVITYQQQLVHAGRLAMKASVKFGLFLAAAVLLTAVPFLATGQDKTPTKTQVTSDTKKGLRVFFASHSLLWYAPNPIGDLAKAVGITNHKLVGHQQIGG